MLPQYIRELLLDTVAHVSVELPHSLAHDVVCLNRQGVREGALLSVDPVNVDDFAPAAGAGGAGQDKGAFISQNIR